MSGSTVEPLDLEQLTQERRDEKRLSLRLKLFQNVWTIRNQRVFRAKTKPFPEGAFELLLSNQIWEKVLEYLTESTDLTTASFTSGTFAQILTGGRVLLMLPKVLHSFKEKSGKVLEAREEWRTGNEWKTTCLNVREISKACKDAAEFEAFDSDYAMDDWYLDTLRMAKSGKACIFRSEEECVDRVMSLLAHLNASLCLIRSVHVYLTHNAMVGIGAFVWKVLEFLRIHGSAVWFFTFRTPFLRTQNIVRDYDYLWEMLECMPNLKGLTFGINAEGQTGEAIQNFRQRLNERPFPTLHSLEHLFSFLATDDSLLPQILGKCVNLKSVILSSGQTVPNEVTQALMGHTLERYSGLAGTITSNRMAWPLKYVTLEGESGEYLRVSLVFPALNRFLETLQHLEFVLATVIVDVSKVRLDLPHLKVLKMGSISIATMGFDDLLLLKSLEKLIVRSVNYEDENALVKVKRYFDKQDMNKSNVWQCFPNLKSVETVWRHFFRPTP